MEDYTAEMIKDMAFSFCPQCGTAIVPNHKGRPRKFCSPECRSRWNNTHPKPENWKTVRSKICPVCGREFSYRHQYGLERKYYRPEREEVRSQRLAGFECVEIAENTGLSLEQVTDYCRELGLPETGSCQLQPPDGSRERHCPVCGRILVQRGNSGRRRFCSPECREEYYRQHKSFRIAVCKNCGREFHAVDEGKRQRKFCSLNCYWNYRYGSPQRP